MQTVAQLTTAPTADVIFAQMIQGLVNLGIPADRWRKGGVGRSLLYVVATSFASLAGLITLFASSAFLDTATGDWLTLLAAKVYGVTRVVATYASGSINASNTGGGNYTWTPGQLTVQDVVTLQLYTNTTTVTVNAGQLNVPIPIQALIQGTIGNANPGDIQTLITSAPGVAITNPLAVVGIDAQTDAALRSVCQAKLGALSLAGPRGAYAYAIQTAITAGGAPVAINRWSISPSSSTGQVTIYLASPSGAAAAGDVTAVVNNVEAVARPDSVTVAASSAVPVVFSPILTVWVRGTIGPGVPSSGQTVTLAGIDANAIATLVATALTANASAYPIGGVNKPPSTQGYLYDETIRAWAQSAHPNIFAVDSAVQTDFPINPNQVAALAATINVRLVATAATS